MYSGLLVFVFMCVLVFLGTGDSFAATAYELRQHADESRDKAGKLRRAASKCRERVSSGELANCTIKVPWKNNEALSIQQAEALAAELDQDARNQCDAIKNQLEMDKTALERQKNAIEMGQKELEEWTKKNEEAQEKALKDGISAIVGGITEKLETYKNSARAYQGWLTKYEKKMRKEGIPFDRLRDKIYQANAGYELALSNIALGSILKTGRNGVENFDGFKAEISAIAERITSSNREVREALSDPRVQKYLEHDRPDVDFELFIAGEVIEKIPGMKIPTQLSSFVVNYGYDATQWTASRNRILQQYHLVDQELKAVDSLKHQIEKTVEESNKCR